MDLACSVRSCVTGSLAVVTGAKPQPYQQNRPQPRHKPNEHNGQPANSALAGDELAHLCRWQSGRTPVSSGATGHAPDHQRPGLHPACHGGARTPARRQSAGANLPLPNHDCASGCRRCKAHLLSYRRPWRPTTRMVAKAVSGGHKGHPCSPLLWTTPAFAIVAPVVRHEWHCIDRRLCAFALWRQRNPACRPMG